MIGANSLTLPRYLPTSPNLFTSNVSILFNISEQGWLGFESFVTFEILVDAEVKGGVHQPGSIFEPHLET